MASTRRVVLLGKSGSGKSSLANTILGEDVFSVNHSPNSDASTCCAHTKNVHGRILTLIDTPGLFDTDPSKPAFSSEIMRCLEESAPGPHAFLLVLKVEKYTQLEQAVVDLILQYFSPEALKYTTVVFTNGNNLPPGMRIEDWARQNAALSVLLQKCRNRCHVVDNQYWRNQEEIYRNNQNQVEDLLNTIDLAVAANEGSYFTSALLQDRSLWARFREAPLGIQLAAVLGVAVVGYLLYTTIPWATIKGWVAAGAKNGSAWIWGSLKTTDDVKKAVEYLSQLQSLFQVVNSMQTCTVATSGSFCTVL